MYDEEERRQELLRRRAIRRRHKMREKRRRVRRRRFMLSVLVAAIVLFCLIRLGMLAYSAIHSRIDKTEQQAGQTEQTQSEKQTEQTESSYSMAIITTAAGRDKEHQPVCGTVCGKFPDDCTARDRRCRSAAVFRKG